MTMSPQLEARLDVIFAAGGDWDRQCEMVRNINKRLFLANGDTPLVVQVATLRKIIEDHQLDHEVKRAPYERFMWLVLTALTFGTVGYLVRIVLDKLAA